MEDSDTVDNITRNGPHNGTTNPIHSENTLKISDKAELLSPKAGTIFEITQFMFVTLNL